jgi:hypothetical protein
MPAFLFRSDVGAVGNDGDVGIPFPACLHPLFRLSFAFFVT